MIAAGVVHAARGVGEHALEIGDGVDVRAEVAVERHRHRALQRHAGGAPEIFVAGHRQRAHGHAVEAVGEVDDVGAAGHLAGDLERRLDRVGAGRAGELHHVVVETARRQQDVVHRLEEAFLGLGVQIETVGDRILLDVIDQRLFEDRVVVAEIQGAGAGEKVEVAGAMHVPQFGAACAAEDAREIARVGLHLRFQSAKDLVLLPGSATLTFQHRRFSLSRASGPHLLLVSNCASSVQNPQPRCPCDFCGETMGGVS